MNENENEATLTVVETNDSGDVIIKKIKKSDLEASSHDIKSNQDKMTDSPRDPKRQETDTDTLKLVPRNSLDPESSLKRMIDDYTAVMKKQDAQSRRNSKESIKSSPREQPVEVNNDNKKKKPIKICSIS